MCCGFAAHCHGTEISPWFFHGFSQVTTHIAFQAARTGNLVRAHWELPEGIGFWWFLISMLFNCARSHRMSCSRPVGALKRSRCNVLRLRSTLPWDRNLTLVFFGFSQVTTHIAFQAARTGNLVRAHWEPPEGIGFWWFLISMLFNCARSHRMSCSRPVGALKRSRCNVLRLRSTLPWDRNLTLVFSWFFTSHNSHCVRSRQLAQATWWGHIGNLQKELAFDDFWLACYSIVPARTGWVVAGQWGH